jgi:hypothetical protein
MLDDNPIGSRVKPRSPPGPGGWVGIPHSSLGNSTPEEFAEANCHSRKSSFFAGAVIG